MLLKCALLGFGCLLNFCTDCVTEGGVGAGLLGTMSTVSLPFLNDTTVLLPLTPLVLLLSSSLLSLLVLVLNSDFFSIWYMSVFFCDGGSGGFLAGVTTGLTWLLLWPKLPLLELSMLLFPLLT